MTDPLAAYDRAAEVSAILDLDETALGQVWRRYNAGITVQQIADEDGITVGPVYQYVYLIRALRDGEVTTSPSVAAKHAGRIRTWLKRVDFSPALRRELVAQLDELEIIAANTIGREQEDQAAAAVTEKAENEGRPGIYVYTLPHYVRHPFEPKTGKTLLKVGHSSVDAYYRATSQGRLTALPEDPVLLRIYPTEASAQVERQFHDWLGDADHARSDARRGGTEWFVTSTRFLDRVARTLGLEILEFNAAFDPADS